MLAHWYPRSILHRSKNTPINFQMGMRHRNLTTAPNPPIVRCHNGCTSCRIRRSGWPVVCSPFPVEGLRPAETEHVPDGNMHLVKRNPSSMKRRTTGETSCGAMFWSVGFVMRVWRTSASADRTTSVRQIKSQDWYWMLPSSEGVHVGIRKMRPPNCQKARVVLLFIYYLCG